MTAGTRLWARFTLSLFCFGGLVLGFVAGQSGDDQKKKASPPAQPWILPEVFTKPAPATVEELRAIEQQVQKVVEKVMPSVVNLRVGPGQGSGVIISENGLILTAGHVSGKPNADATVVFPNGTSLKGKTLGQNKAIDSGMVKIVPEGKYPFLEMGKSSQLKKGQWVIAIGHPGGFRSNRSPVVRVGRILTVTPFAIQTDCTLVGGDSGGPLFDMQGRVIGIHSRIGGSAITENIHVPVDTFRQTFARLEKGESWGGELGSIVTVQSAGGKSVFKKEDTLAKGDPTALAPKDKLDGTPDAEAKNSFYKTYTFRMKAGSTYTIDMIAANTPGNGPGKKKKKAPPIDEKKILDPFLRLESPGGKILAEDDDGAGNMNSRIVFKAIKDGDYRITATSFEGEQTGRFTVKIDEADLREDIVSGQVDLLRAVKLSAVPGVVERTLGKLKADKKGDPYINALLLDNNGDPMANREIVINWEKGTQKLKSDNEGIVRWPLATDKIHKLNLLLPAGIRAMVALTDKQGKHLLPADLSIETVKSAGGKIVQTFDGTLKSTDPFDFEREKCVRHIHDFKVQSGKTFTFDLTSDGFDAFMRLEDADGNKIAEDDNGAGFYNSRIVYSPKTDETVRIVATTCHAGELGGYRLVIRETNAKTTEPKIESKK